MMDTTRPDSAPTEPTPLAAPDQREDFLHSDSSLPRIAMVSTHGYVAAQPPLGAADTGGQVVYVLELSKKLAQLGYEVDIWTRRFEDQPELEAVASKCESSACRAGANSSSPRSTCPSEAAAVGRERAAFHQEAWAQVRVSQQPLLGRWGGGQHLSEALDVPHVHTPHSLGLWKKRQMESDYPGDAAKFEKQYNFIERIRRERLALHGCRPGGRHHSPAIRPIEGRTTRPRRTTAG
jgi:mannosylfructose-phosphate synthase